MSKLYLDPECTIELDSDIYVVEQVLENVTVEILKNKTTGEYSVGWKRQENTIDITEKENYNG